jgi:hypothetical protein
MEFELLLAGLQSPDASIRVAQEAQYQQLKASSPDALVLQLSQFLTSHNLSNSKLAAVLLRRCLEDESESGAWNRLYPAERKDLLKNQVCEMCYCVVLVTTLDLNWTYANLRSFAFFLLCRIIPR